MPRIANLVARGPITRGFMALAAGAVAATLGTLAILAQGVTVTSNPATVDAGNPQAVVLTVPAGENQANAEIVSKVTEVTVGGQAAAIVSRNGQTSITINPPALNLSGRQPLQLIDAAKKVLAEGELRYLSAVERPVTVEDAIRQREQARRDTVAGSYIYYAFVAALFLAVLGPFVLAIYRGTSGTGTTDRPLGLPVGSFRAILAYSLVAYLGFYVLTSILSVSYFNPPDFLLGIVATVIGFYFGSRSSDEGGAAATAAGTIRGTVRQGAAPSRGALVKFNRAADGTTPYTRISDVEGRFELTGIVPGKYTVQAALTGSGPSDAQEIAVTEGSDHELEIVLKPGVPQAPAPAGTVEVTVKKPDGSVAVQAKVVLSQLGAEKSSATTDAAGKARIERLTAGDYEVEAFLAPHGSSGRTPVKVMSPGSQSVALALK